MNDNRFDVDYNGRAWPHPYVEVTIMALGFDTTHLSAYLTTDQARLYGLEMIRKADLADAEPETEEQED